MKLSALLLATLACATVSAQGTAQPPVRLQGILLDKATRSPIAGATVTAGVFGSPRPEITVGSSDGGGRFNVTVPAGVAFTLNAVAAGYEAAQLRQSSAVQNDAFFEIALDRLAEIRGRLVDDDTRKPLAGMAVALVRPDILLRGTGNPTTSAGSITTQEDGEFHFRDQRRGGYYVRIQGTPAPVFQEIAAKDLEGDHREKALEVPEAADGYGIVVWPGEDADAPKAPPIQVASDIVDVGEIRLRQHKLHNLSGVLRSCDEGTSLQVLLLGKNGTGNARLAELDTTCGSGFRILNLPEGSFTLVAQGGPPRLFTSETIDGRTRGPLFVDVSASVAVQILFEVENAPVGTAPDDLKKINLSITADNPLLNIDSPARGAPGEYEARLFGGEAYRLWITPPQSYYVKQLSYNGVPAEARFTALTSPLSTLRVVLSNRPGTVEVQASAGSTVYLVKDGAIYADLTGGGARFFQQAGADGRARFAGLGPGKYRAFLGASIPDSQATLDEALKKSTAVTVEEGQTASLSLALP